MRPKWYAHLREGHLVTCNCCPWLYNHTCTSGGRGGGRGCTQFSLCCELYLTHHRAQV